MDLIDMNREQRLELQLKRKALFTKIASKYNSLEDFTRDYDEKLAILGIELTYHNDHVSLRMELGWGEYDQYYILTSPSGRLTCSPIIGLQDEYCANLLRNIVTGEYVDDEDDIFKY